MERLAEERGPQSSEVPTVDHTQRRSISSDHAGGDRVEDDARARGPMPLAGKRDEVPESHTRDEARARVLLGVRAVHSVDRGRVHDPLGTDEPGQGRCDAVRRVSGQGPAHDDDRVSLGELRGRGVAGGGLAVRPTAKGGGRAVGVQVLELVSEVIDQAGAAHGRPLALGISAPGIVDQASGRVTSLAYNVAPEGGFDPLEVIRDRFDLPVLVDNNVNLAAVGEKWFGLARGVSTMVFIAIGAGIGMGIIIDDELVRGAHGAAGEIGYLPLVGDPFNPRHRLHGGLEDEIGATGIVAAFNHARGAGDPEIASVEDLFERATAGDATARSVVDNVASRLGTAIATVCAILDPELVVLGGGIGANPLLLRPARGSAAALVPVTARIETSLLGERAALQGAIAVALNAARTKLLSGGVPVAGRS